MERGGEVDAGAEAVGNRPPAGRLGDPGNLAADGQAAAEGDVGLEDLQAAADQVLEVPERHAPLARRDRHRGLGTELGIAREVVLREGLLEPGDAVRLKPLRSPQRRGRVPALAGVDHQVAVVADGPAGRLDVREIDAPRPCRILPSRT